MRSSAASSPRGARPTELWCGSCSRAARVELLDLDRPLIDAVQDALGLLERDPHAGYELRGRLRGLRSLHVGAYRIVYQLTGGERTVRVAAIRHRAVAYRADPR